MDKPKHITKPQIRTLRAAAAQTFPEDDLYRSWLGQTFPGKAWRNPERPSTLDLTIAEADRAIRELIGPPSTTAAKKQRQPSGNRRVHGLHKGRYYGAGQQGAAKHLTQNQADFLAILEDDMVWTNNEDRLLGFIERQIGERKPVNMLTRRQATKVITGLRKLAAQPYAL